MRNRAVITWPSEENTFNLRDPGIYLHHDGDYNTVRALLEYCRLKEFRKPDEDPYGLARFCQVAANYIGGDLGIGASLCGWLDFANGDNGVYICKGWDIVKREYVYGEDKINYDTIYNVMVEANQAMPKADRVHISKIHRAIRKMQNNDQRRKK